MRYQTDFPDEEWCAPRKGKDLRPAELGGVKVI